MFPKAVIAQIDMAPQGLQAGMKAGDLHLQADAKLAAIELTRALKALGGGKATIRAPEIAKRIKDEPVDSTPYTIEAGPAQSACRDRGTRLGDPEEPTTWFPAPATNPISTPRCAAANRRTIMRHPRIRRAIGSGLGYAIGVEAAKRQGKTVLFEGDGSILMHIQELEMIQRHKLKILFCIFNDGAYGAEIHKLREDGIDDTCCDLRPHRSRARSPVPRLRGATITDVVQIKPPFEAYQEAG